MRSAFGPLHLLTLGESFADEGIDGALRHSRGDTLARSVSFSIVDEAAGVVVNIDGELTRGPAEALQMLVVQFQGCNVFAEVARLLPGAMLVSVPKQPLDPFELL